MEIMKHIACSGMGLLLILGIAGVACRRPESDAIDLADFFFRFAFFGLIAG